MKKVKFKRYEKNKDGINIEVWYHGSFHEFGLDYQETDFGIGTYSVGLIEDDDGQIHNIPSEHIKFIKTIKTKYISHD